MGDFQWDCNKMKHCRLKAEICIKWNFLKCNNSIYISGFRTVILKWWWNFLNCLTIAKTIWWNIVEISHSSSINQYLFEPIYWEYLYWACRNKNKQKSLCLSPRVCTISQRIFDKHQLLKSIFDQVLFVFFVKL